MLEKLKKRLLGKKRNKKPEKRREPIRVSPKLEDNITLLKGILGDKSDEIVFRRPFSLCHSQLGDVRLVLVYIDDLIDKKTVNDNIIRPLLSTDVKKEFAKVPPHKVCDFLVEQALNISEIKVHTNIELVVKELLGGHTVILGDNLSCALVANTQGWKEIGIQSAEVERSIRGPQSAFSENINVNIGLIRRRIKSADFKVEQFILGSYTQTKVCVAYVEGIVPKRLVDEVRRRLDSIDIDQILGGNQVGELIEDNPTSPFDTFYQTQRPDVAAAGVLEGRVLIIADGNPNGIVVPKLFIENFTSPDDYYTRHWNTIFTRFIRVIAMIASTTLPGFYISVVAFHQEVIPTVLLNRIYSGRAGVPFSSFVEMVIVGVFFEALREANARTPVAFGSAISIIGALILGQSAVTAGILSASGVIVGAVTGIAIFLLPVEEFNQSLLHLRVLFTGAAAGFGFYGMIIAAILVLLHLNSLRSFGIPFMRPVSPIVLSDLKDVVMRVPYQAMKTRPKSLENTNQVRAKLRLKRYFSKYQMWEDE